MIQTDKRLFRDTGYCNNLIASWAIFLRFQVAQVTFWLPWATANLDTWLSFYLGGELVFFSKLVYTWSDSETFWDDP